MNFQSKVEHYETESLKIKVAVSEQSMQSVNTNVSAIPNSNVFNIRATTATPVTSKTPISSASPSAQTSAAEVRSQQARLSRDETSTAEGAALASRLAQSTSKQSETEHGRPRQLDAKQSPQANAGKMS